MNKKLNKECTEQWRIVVSSIATIFLIMLYGVIFSFSEQDGETSGSLSRMISEKCVEFLNALSGKGWSELMMEGLAEYFENPIRKLAHFAEYAVMGCLLFGMWYPWLGATKNGKEALSDEIHKVSGRGLPLLWKVIVPWVFISAALDEVHQLFTPGRCGNLGDVLLDTSGGCFGLVCCILVLRKKKRGISMKTRKMGIFNRLFLILAVLLLMGNAVLGFLAYGRSQKSLFGQIQSNAKNIAQCAAMNVSGELLQGIDVGEEGTEDYETIIEELVLFRDNADIEYIYTLRQVGETSFEFVVDSDPEEPAAIGEVCEETEALIEAFSAQITTADDAPFQDEWGSHVSAYSPVFDGSAVVGVVGVDISANWIDEQMMALRNLVLVTCIVTYAVSMLLLQFVMLRFKRSVNKLNDKVKELASGSGDLRREIDIRSGDELEEIAKNMNAFLGQIRDLVKEVAQSTDDILEAGEELNTTVKNNSMVMSGMNSEIQDISANMEESVICSRALSESLADSAEHIAAFAKNVEGICAMVQKANANAQNTSVLAKENRKNALDTIEVLQDRIRKTKDDVAKIEQVKNIAEEIGTIASQTRMLSLNAQIEAARAGAMGAGFAVVATEVGKLSNDIDRAVAEINHINGQVLTAVDALTEALAEMIRFMGEDVAKDYDAFAALGEEYGNTTDTIRVQMTEIGKQSAQISQNISDINASVQTITTTVTMTAESAHGLAESTNQIAESFEGLCEASQKNTQHSENLNEQVGKYSY